MKTATLVLPLLLIPAAEAVEAQCQLLTDPDPHIGAIQGDAMASDGTTMLLAPQQVAAPPVEVLVFRRDPTGWSYEATLVPPTGEDWSGSEFGISVAVKGDLAAVGAPGMDGGFGRVVLYERTEDPVTGLATWSFAQSLVHATWFFTDFGRALAFDGATLAVGAPFNDFIQPDSGVVVVFDVANGVATYSIELFPCDVEEDAYFGRSVDVLGTRLVAGATGKDDLVPGDDRGYVTAFASNSGSWTRIDCFTAPGSGVRTFGWAVELVTDGLPFPTAFVSAPNTPVGGVGQAGTVYRFREEPIIGGVRWYHADTFTASPPDPQGGFGRAIAAFQPFFGAPRLVVGESNATRVHVFEQSGGWNLAGIQGSPNGRTNFGASLFADGRGYLAGSLTETVDANAQGGAFVFTWDGDCPDAARLAAPGVDAGDALGASADVRGGVAVFGLPGDDAVAADAGSAAVYRWDAGAGGWERECVLVASDAVPGDAFGSSVALSADGTLALVGAPGRDAGVSDAGAAYLFTRDGADWVELGAFLSPAPRLAGRFGSAVAMDAGRAVVGEPGSSALAGKAWTYRDDGGGSWTPHVGLSPDDPGTAGGFGAAVALSAGRLVVGDPEDDDAGVDAGAAYVHRFDPGSDAWVPEQKLVPTLAGDLRFGTALDLEHGALAVGVPDASVGGAAGAGRAHRYALNSQGTWLHEAALLDEAPVADGGFGAAVALDGPLLAVGASGPGTDPSAVRVFERALTTVRVLARLVPDGASPDAAFGAGLSFDAGSLMVGAPDDDSEGSLAGSAWAYRVKPRRHVRAGIRGL